MSTKGSVKISDVLAHYEQEKKTGRFSDKLIAWLERAAEKAEGNPFQDDIESALSHIDKIQRSAKSKESTKRLIRDVNAVSTSPAKKIRQEEEKEESRISPGGSHSYINAIIDRKFAQYESRMETKIDSQFKHLFSELNKHMKEMKKEAVDEVQIRDTKYWTPFVRQWIKDNLHEYKFLQEVPGELLTVLNDIQQTDPNALNLSPERIVTCSKNWSDYAASIWSTIRCDLAHEIQEKLSKKYKINEDMEIEDYIRIIGTKLDQEFQSKEEMITAVVNVHVKETSSLSNRAFYTLIITWYLSQIPLNSGGGKKLWPAYVNMKKALAMQKSSADTESFEDESSLSQG